MFKKFIASLGIGSAEVDAQFEKKRYIAGEEVHGKVVLKGGNADQQIDLISLFLMTEVLKEVDDRKVREEQILHRFHIADSFVIKEGEHKEVTFSFILPSDTPSSFGRLPIWFQTGLDIPMAIDPQDRDYIHVDPSESTQTVLTAIQHELGFKLRKVEMEYARNQQVIQEFEFAPSDKFGKDLEELEVVFFHMEEGLEILMQVDRKAKGLGGLFAEALDVDESHIRLNVYNQEIEQGSKVVAQKLRQVIEQHS